MPKHSHENQEPGHRHSHPARITARAKDVPGLIYIERRLEDEAIVISGSLIIKTGVAQANETIAEELEAAARKINELGGVVGHIKASVAASSTHMISVTDEKAMVKESPLHKVQITLAAIVFAVEPEEAENIVRQALSGIRARMKE